MQRQRGQSGQARRQGLQVTARGVPSCCRAAASSRRYGAERLLSETAMCMAPHTHTQGGSLAGPRQRQQVVQREAE